ncbi:MAG: hypothetical protein HFG37_05515 [Eubacterium sp.]|nr:hypothetical protein [Eubacterium sp.]
MNKNNQRKLPFGRQTALLLTGALLAGLLPMGTEVKSQAMEQPALQNPRILKTTQEVAPGFAGKKELKKPTTDNKGITTWDCIWFGNYWQEDTNGDGKADKNDEKTPIKWRVLSVEGDDVFLLADKNLDVQSYNDTETDITWETSTMRSWLNGYGAEMNRGGKNYSNNNFLNNAFSADEQSAIETTNVVNDDNPEYSTEGGNDTSDKVYLLSIDEMAKTEYGFTSSDGSTNTRLAVNTAYTMAGGESGVEDMASAGNTDYWWLRSPGLSSRNASYVISDGCVYADGDNVSSNYYAARPALHLNLSSDSSWSYAGTVPSDNVAEWDCIWFGNYWQEDCNGDGKADKNDEKTPIKWRVLSVEGDDVFLLADKNLDVQRYNDTYTDVTWETSTMRSWLNGYGGEINKDGKDYSDNNFIDHAFSADEQTAIKTADVVNNDNLEDGSEGGNDTSDKVYLLSIDEVRNPEYGFISSTSSTYTREAVNTAYVAGEGEIRSSSMNSAGSAYDWWLRSPGLNSYYASFVNFIGNVRTSGNIVYIDDYATRPALHLNLSSRSSWSYAGIVASNGEVEELVPTPKPTHSPGTAPTIPPTQTMLPPSATAVPVPDGIGAWDNSNVRGLKKGDYFVAGNIKYRVAKLKGKNGEAAVAGVKSKKSKSLVIPQKVKKEGITFTVTSIQKNAFKGCKKAKKLTIKSTSIRGITKKALTGFSKRIQIKIPKSKVPQYWSALRKLGYSKIDW